MPTFSNAGGSLGSAIILTLLAWGVRWARSELGRRKQPDSSDAAPGCVSPFHARVSVKTLFGLLETRACKFLLVDVRPFTEADFVDGALGVGETDVHGSLLPVTPRLLSPRVSGRFGNDVPRREGAETNGAETNGAETNGAETNGASTPGEHAANNKPKAAATATPSLLRKTVSLPREFRGAIRLPYDLVGDVLSSRETWEATFPHVKCPDTFTILVLLGESEEQECRAASKLNALGYQRSLCVKGSIHALLREESELDDEGFELGFGKGPEVKYIGRDGLATLMGSGLNSLERPDWDRSDWNDSSGHGWNNVSEQSSAYSEGSGNERRDGMLSSQQQSPNSTLRHDVLVIDVRRRDEVILYGAIRGAKHVPIDQLASALSPNMGGQAFRDLYHFDKPNKNQLLVFCSRAFSRATWAAHVAMDAGYDRVCVYGSGTCGWKNDDAVCAYASYGIGDAPPSPMSCEKEAIDYQRGFAEVSDLMG